MKKQPIHQNLNTSFVNVAALVRYLRSLQFVGSIRIELSSYEADIVFTGSKIRAREYDHIAGRISHGDDALERILVRAKEPHGRIHVYKAVEGYAGQDDGSVFVDRSIMKKARRMAANHGGTVVSDEIFELVMSGQDGEKALMLAALSELLRLIDESLAKGNLSFPAAFRNACDAITPDHAFMKQRREALVYRDGEICLNVAADPKSIASAVFAALQPIFRRLRDESKYAELLNLLTATLRDSSTARRPEYVSLGLMSYIEELLNGDV